MKCSRSMVGAALACVAAVAQAAPVIFAEAGLNAVAINPKVDEFRMVLGGVLNANEAGSFGTGRREINWDGVLDGSAAPNNLPGDFFNVTSPRGIVMATTPGSAFQVSADADNAANAAIKFGNINANYPALFAPFSAQRLFTAIGSNIVDVRFFVPGSTTAALTNGFGVVFSDVDVADTTMIEYFDANDLSLGSHFAPHRNGIGTFSFLGVIFDEGKVVSRARITSGNQILGPLGAEAPANGNDLVVMDDFIYGEPVAARHSVPEPSTLALLVLAMAITVGSRRARRN